MSMKPGATMHPLASRVRLPSSPSPTATTRSPSTATSARVASVPVPSATSPPRTTRLCTMGTSSRPQTGKQALDRRQRNAPQWPRGPSGSALTGGGHMKLKGVGYVGINSTDVEAWRPFAVDVLGLMPVDAPIGSGASNSLWLKMDRRHWRIAVHPSDHQGLAYVGWELADAASFDAAVKELDANGLAVKIPDESERATRAVKALARFEDPMGHTHELFW